MFARTLISKSFRLPTNYRNVTSVRFSSTFKLNPTSIVSTYSKGPINLKFTEEHEWISIHPDGTSFVGITNYASEALGDATFVETPTDRIGEEITHGEAIGSVESVKSASDIYSPVDGTVLGANESLDHDPSLINSDPMGDGWIAKIKLSDNYDLGSLLNQESYEKFVKESDH